MVWLSRGLFEALTTFIGRAAGNDGSDCKLRAMLYEFRYLPVGQAFAAARTAGADVGIRYEAQSYKDENEAMITEAGIVGKMKKLGTRDPNAGFLKEQAKEWVPQNFQKGRKDLRRRYFMGA